MQRCLRNTLHVCKMSRKSWAILPPPRYCIRDKLHLNMICLCKSSFLGLSPFKGLFLFFNLQLVIASKLYVLPLTPFQRLSASREYLPLICYLLSNSYPDRQVTPTVVASHARKAMVQRSRNVLSVR